MGASTREKADPSEPSPRGSRARGAQAKKEGPRRDHMTVVTIKAKSGRPEALMREANERAVDLVEENRSPVLVVYDKTGANLYCEPCADSPDEAEGERDERAS